MKKSLHVIFAIILFAFSQQVYGQFRLAIGPALGMNFNLHGGSDLDEGGTGFGIAFAGQVDMTYNQSKSLGTLINIAFYDNRSGSSETTTSQQNVAITQENDVSISYFQLETLFKYRLPVGVYFIFGPQIGFDLSADLEVTQRITTPGYYFQGGSTSQKSKSTIKDTNARFALLFGAGMDIPLSDLITLAPHLNFGFALSDVIEDVDYSIHSFQAGVACKFNLIQ